MGHSYRGRLLRSSVLAGFVLTAFGAFTTAAIGQESEPASSSQTESEEEAQRVDRVVVTGSRIARSALNAPTPLTTVGRDEILLSGEPNVVDFLADIPSLSGSTVPEDTTGSNLNDGGLSLLNLRQLGSVRTLVLVDGRRHVGSSPGTLSVDVDTIPSMLVERVEVVTGGNSALYGADAVSGVVNFIMRDDFEGIEVDAAYSQVNQDGQAGRRISAALGENFLDGRLNAYVFGEYQDVDEVLDFDVDWRRDSRFLRANDTDPATAPSDGVFDQVLVRNVRDVWRSRGGALILSNQPQPSATNDPDVARLVCPSSTSTLSSNCTSLRPGTVFVFNADGTARPANWGAFQANGFNPRFNVGGDGLNLGTEQGQGSRTPRSENRRFQTGFTFELTPSAELFGEAKYVEEETFDSGQPTFYNATLRQGPSLSSGGNAFLLRYTDNAYLNAFAPNVVAAINNNVRPVFAAPTPDAPGVQTGVVADPRALLVVFGPSRNQLNQRDLSRFVLGARGDVDRLGFIDNISWEVGYTYGEMNNSNFETGTDNERFFYAADAVVDTTNATGKGLNSIVCRVQLTAATGGVNADIVGRTGGANLAANDPAIAGCTPISLFGTDFRSDADNKHATGGGGRQGLTPEQEEYLLATIEVTDQNRQHSLLAFGSGELWDFWGAGPIGVALGYEFRREETEGTGRDRDTAGRSLFLNGGPDFEPADYDANEIFTELRLPLISGHRFMQTAEISGAYRYSDYTTVGGVETYSFQALARPTEDLLLRATYGEAVRIPNLGENFRPATQTFGNGLTDPCSPDRIRGRTSLTAAERDQLRANCLATMPSGYNPGTDAPGTGTPVAINYSSGVPGFNSGNPSLEPEESTSFTVGFAATPRWFENVSFSADYYDIEITNVIASVTIQQAMNQCVGILAEEIGSVNPGACATFERSAAAVGNSPEYGVITFIQGSLNYAGLVSRGVDFTAGYDHDLGRWGELNWGLRGTWLIQDTAFTNIASPTEPTDDDANVGNPHVRLLSTLTWRPNDKLALSWDWDWQASQEIVDADRFGDDEDRYDRTYYETTPFNQHDFSVRYQASEELALRAGVVNAFDQEPDSWLGSQTTADNFDLFGRRYFVGLSASF